MHAPRKGCTETRGMIMIKERFIGFTRPADPTKADFTMTTMGFARRENPKS